MIPEAIIFPSDPEGLVFDMSTQIGMALLAGGRLYTNGERLGIFRQRAPRGWFPMAIVDRRTTPDTDSTEGDPPCAA